MSRFTTLLLLSGLLVVAVAGPARAGRCLGVAESRIVWCDDFDNYCTNAGVDPWPGYPPLPTTICPTDGSAVEDETAFQANWTAECTELMDLDNDVTRIYNLPFAARYRGDRDELAPEQIHAQRHSWDLTAAINAKTPGHNAINGTDETPLMFKFFIHTGASGNYGNSPLYLELTLNGDRAPTDWVSIDCSPEAQGPYIVVCQQNRYWESSVNTICPPLDTTIHASFAYGMLAQLDPNPCDVENGRRPTRYHAVVFDGLQWTEIRENRFPPGLGDFSLDNGTNWFTVTIKSTQAIVELENPTKCAAGFCSATVPRQYTGPFNTVAMGTGAGCELNPTTGECVGPEKCFDYNDWYKESWLNYWVDSPVLWDGVTVSLTGACCAADGTCTETDQASCESGGGRFQGLDTTCAEVQCCPYPFADGDTDGDVDQADFGLWQACYDGGNGLIAGCECYDRDGNNTVDGADFTEFTNCFTGANVPFDPQVQTACNPG